MGKGLPSAKVRQLELQHSVVVPPRSKFFPGTQTPIPEGVTIRSSKGVQIEFMYQGVRRTETLRGTPTIGHVLKACAIRQRVIQSIGLGLFNYADEFPGSQQAKLARNAEQPRKVPTVGEALDSWLITVKNTIGENAFIDYSKDIKGQLKKTPLYALDSGSAQGSKRSLGTLGEMPVDQLTAGGINNLRNWFLARPVSVKRLMNLLIPLRGALSQLAQDEIIESDPFERVRPLKRKKKRVEPLPLRAVAGAAPLLSIEQVARFKEDDDRPDPFSPDEVAAFLAHMTEPFVYLVKFWLWTGLRTGELIALQWRDIDWERGEICVRNSLSRGIYKETKSDRVRWVKLLDPAREPLQAQFAHSGQAGTYVFPNPHTQKRWANESKICARFKKALASAGVRYRRPYHCRHTYASTLLSAGESTLFVAEQLGHRDWSMVLRHYGRWIPTVDALAGTRVANSPAAQLNTVGNSAVLPPPASASSLPVLVSKDAVEPVVDCDGNQDGSPAERSLVYTETITPKEKEDNE